MTFNSNISELSITIDADGASGQIQIHNAETRANLYVGEWPNVTTIDSTNVNLDGGIIM